MRTRNEPLTPKKAKRKKNKPANGPEDDFKVPGLRPGVDSSCVHIAQLFKRQPEIMQELTRSLRTHCAARVGVIRKGR